VWAAEAGALSFLANPRYRRFAAATRAGALVLVEPPLEFLEHGFHVAKLAGNDRAARAQHVADFHFRADLAGDLPDFAKATLSDVQLFENFDEEAQLLIEGGETAKARPQETSRWLQQTADEIDALIASADGKVGTHRGRRDRQVPPAR